MKTHPPIDALITCETSKRPYRELFLARYHQQQWTAKKLFTIGIICRDSGLSPDKQWYYCASVNNGTFLGRVGQPKLKKISEELLNCRFSPDGRYLLGTEHFSGGIIVFDLSRNARAIVIAKPSLDATSHESGWPFGWYPDGRAFWYCQGRDSEVYFRVLVGSWQRQRLSAREAKQIPVDWDLLDPRFWYPGTPNYWRLHRPKTVPKGYYVYRVEYAYSWNHRFRLRVIQYETELPYEKKPPDLPQFGRFKYEISLEDRRGHSQVLASLEDRDTGVILPRAVSNDGKWTIWAAEPPLNDPVRQMEPGTFMRAVLMDVSTGEQHLLPDEVPGIGRHPSYLWFDEK